MSHLKTPSTCTYLILRQPLVVRRHIPQHRLKLLQECTGKGSGRWTGGIRTWGTRAYAHTVNRSDDYGLGLRAHLAAACTATRLLCQSPVLHLRPGLALPEQLLHGQPSLLALKLRLLIMQHRMNESGTEQTVRPQSWGHRRRWMGLGTCAREVVAPGTQKGLAPHSTVGRGGGA